jgi:hypothetical protein
MEDNIPKRFEYKAIIVDITLPEDMSELNQLGAEGWEVIYQLPTKVETPEGTQVAPFFLLERKIRVEDPVHVAYKTIKVAIGVLEKHKNNKTECHCSYCGLARWVAIK